MSLSHGATGPASQYMLSPVYFLSLISFVLASCWVLQSLCFFLILRFFFTAFLYLTMYIERDKKVGPSALYIKKTHKHIASFFFFIVASGFNWVPVRNSSCSISHLLKACMREVRGGIFFSYYMNCHSNLWNRKDWKQIESRKNIRRCIA